MSWYLRDSVFFAQFWIHGRLITLIGETHTQPAAEDIYSIGADIFLPTHLFVKMFSEVTGAHVFIENDNLCGGPLTMLMREQNVTYLDYRGNVNSFIPLTRKLSHDFSEHRVIQSVMDSPRRPDLNETINYLSFLFEIVINGFTRENRDLAKLIREEKYEQIVSFLRGNFRDEISEHEFIINFIQKELFSQLKKIQSVTVDNREDAKPYIKQAMKISLDLNMLRFILNQNLGPQIHVVGYRHGESILALLYDYHIFHRQSNSVFTPFLDITGFSSETI